MISVSKWRSREPAPNKPGNPLAAPVHRTGLDAIVIGMVWWPLAKGAGAPYWSSNVLSTAGTSATPITNERNGKTSELIYSRQAPGSIAQFRVL